MPRDYDQRTPKKMKLAALRGALSDRAREGRVHVVTALVDGDTPSTKICAAVLDRPSRPTTSCSSSSARTTWPGRACATSQRVHLLAPDQLNTYDVLDSDDIVFTEARWPTSLKAVRLSQAGTSSRQHSSASQQSETEGTRNEPPFTKTRATCCARRLSPRRATACSTRTSTPSSSTPDSNKTEIKIAVEQVFGVKVISRQHH